MKSHTVSCHFLLRYQTLKFELGSPDCLHFISNRNDDTSGTADSEAAEKRITKAQKRREKKKAVEEAQEKER